jgi:hypothetical protein
LPLTSATSTPTILGKIKQKRQPFAGCCRDRARTTINNEDTAREIRYSNILEMCEQDRAIATNQHYDNELNSTRRDFSELWYQLRQPIIFCLTFMCSLSGDILQYFVRYQKLIY